MSEQAMHPDRRLTVQALIGLGAVLMAWRLHFLQDDAYISFRYAKNFAEGLGLIWQPGEAVQGYTNFLWTLQLGIAHWLGAPIDAAALGLGMAFFAGSLAFFAAIARRLFPDGWLATALLAVLASNYTYLCYATGGLETMQQSFWMLAALLLATRMFEADAWTVPAYLGLSLVFAALMLTRLDSALFIVVLSLALLWNRRHAGPAAMAQVFAWIALPALAIFVAYCAWCLTTYGSIFPNTLEIKSTGRTSGRILAGATFAWTFFERYMLHAPVAVALGIALVWRPHRILTALAVYTVVWVAYVIWTGGDFMEFRFFVTLTPLLVLLMGHAWRSLPWAQSLPAGMAVMLLVISSSAYHGLTMPPYYRNIESVPRLNANMVHPSADWIGLGQRLGALFPQGYDGPVIGISPAGAIPFYSGLPALDLLGLNHKDVAPDALPFLNLPGHNLIASADTIRRYGVSLLIAHPATPEDVEADQEIVCEVFRLKAFGDVRPPDDFMDAPFVAMRINDRLEIAMLYLTPDPRVDRAISNGNLRVLNYDLAACYDS